VIAQHGVEDVIMAVDSTEHEHMSRIMNELEGTAARIKMIPDMYDILSGTVKMTSIFGTPLIEVNPADHAGLAIQPEAGGRHRGLAACALIVLSPVLLIIGAAVKSASPGPVFFRQERIGKHGRPFAHPEVPQHDERCRAQRPAAQQRRRPAHHPHRPLAAPHPHGRAAAILERAQGRDEHGGSTAGAPALTSTAIMEVAPHYRHLHKVRPGITSWGQVKFGYAENVQQMVRRLKYDILYIENMSLAVDLKILAYTVLIILKGDGK
jgi:hypothetical protein